MTKSDPYSLRHQAQRLAKDTDDAEFLALKKGSTVVDAGIYDDRIAGAMDDFEAKSTAVGESWHDEDLKYDNAVGGVHEEIVRRISILGESYPFSIENSTLTYKCSNDYIYEFFLSICCSESITSGDYVHLPRVFERLTARLVASFFGEGVISIHTGAPRDPEIGGSFKSAMEKVNQITTEWWWGPDPGLPNAPVAGDAGCDFIVSPPFPDKRQIGQLFIVGQCACGNDWKDKFYDLTIKKLGKWFNPISLVDPVRCFATPFHITDSMLEEASRNAGLVFDRARLVSIYAKASTETIPTSMRDQMLGLIKLVLKNELPDVG